MSKDHSTAHLTLPRQLRIRISNGSYVAQVSQNLGEFVLGTEILELLRLIDQGSYLSERNHRQLVGALQEASKLCPKPGELQLLLEDLVGSGVVLRNNGKAQQEHPHASGGDDRFADGWIQWAMLADETRVARYKAAIESVVQKNHVALDVGAGSGILSYLLLKSGAEKVIAIEESNASITMRKVMRQLLPAIGKNLDENLQIIHGNASDRIPELLKAAPKGIHAMVSELFGHDPFSEGMLATLREIQSNLMSKSVGGRSRDEIVCIPKNVTVKSSFAKLLDTTHSRCNAIFERIKLWNTSRGVWNGDKDQVVSDIERFRQAFCQVETFDTLSFAAPLRSEDFELKGQPITLMHLNLGPVAPRAETEKAIQARIKVPTIEATTLILVWFEAELAPGISISTLPGSPDHCQHWNPILLPLTEHVQPGKFAQIECALENNETHFSVTFKQDKKIFASR
jgi:hypothetical protein